MATNDNERLESVGTSLIQKWWTKTIDLLNPGREERMEGTPAQNLACKILAFTNEHSAYEVYYAAFYALTILATGLEAKERQANGSPMPTLEEQAVLIRNLDDDGLLDVWYRIGQLDPSERSQAFSDMVTSEFERRGMAVIPHTGI